MKYRFRVSEKPRLDLPVPFHTPPRKRRFRLKARSAPRRKVTNSTEPIAFSSLFEIAALPEHHEPKVRKKRFPVWKKRVTSWAVRVGVALRSAAVFVVQRGKALLGTVAQRMRRPAKPKSIHALPVFAGFLCAALLVSVLSAAGVLFGLFGRYRRSYTGVVIPNLVGQSASTVLQEDTPYLNWVVEYENNPQIEAGLIISQSPRAGVTRRIYGKDGYCTVHLTVSRPQEPYSLENLVGMSERDALLTLRNHNVSASVTQVYSDTVPKGNVMETSPSHGALLSANAKVTLRVSAGKKQSLLSVPNLFGMTETEANALLHGMGLSIGSVSYRSSSHTAGTIIGQDIAAYSSIKHGETVSYTVSVGDRYWLPTVPDLYGMNLRDAEQLLKQHGLLIGRVHTIQGAAPSGTVITQSPAPGAPITSSTVSVELYVSS